MRPLVEPVSDPLALVPSGVVARQLGVKPQTLRMWRHAGRGPDYVRLGNRVAYRRADLDAWIAARTFAHTSAESARMPVGRPFVARESAN